MTIEAPPLEQCQLCVALAAGPSSGWVVDISHPASLAFHCSCIHRFASQCIKCVRVVHYIQCFCRSKSHDMLLVCVVSLLKPHMWSTVHDAALKTCFRQFSGHWDSIVIMSWTDALSGACHGKSKCPVTFLQPITSIASDSNLISFSGCILVVACHLSLSALSVFAVALESRVFTWSIAV